MPTGVNWANCIFAHLGFVAQVFVMYYFSAMANIKANWPEYRCNPIYMPLSDNLEQDFMYCIQTMQTNYMGYLLQPISYLLSGITSMGGDITNGLNDARNMISDIRTFFTSIIQNVFGVFLNIIIEFQKITIGIKDMIGKVVGTMVTLLYLIDGSVMTAQSTWNGTPGKLVRALGSMCFHPDTKMRLKNGMIKKMKDLDLGDILENDSRVNVVMKLDNIYNEPFYKLPGNIYVTGSHMIYDNNSKKYIEVKQFKDACIETEIKSDWFSCLITSDHLIKIGDYMFWDWEDDILK
jgi:hypothetical protein